MKLTFKHAITAVFGMGGVLLWAGLGIRTIETMPDYALVFLDDESKTYMALPCISEWRTRRSNRDKIDRVRPSPASAARQLKYRPDVRCRDAGGFASDDRSLAGHLLAKYGILPPARPWWHNEYLYAEENARAWFHRPLDDQGDDHAQLSLDCRIKPAAKAC